MIFLSLGVSRCRGFFYCIKGSYKININMVFGFLVLLTALAIAGIAAYFSIAGLMAIFSGAAMAVAVMAGSLEVGKLVTASWLYRNWKQTGYFLKTYLTIAVLVLMLITSMGIFGYLSKAHLQQSSISGDVQAKVALLDEKIATERDNIETSRKALQQMDAQVDQLLGRTTDDKGANRAVQVRRQQKAERTRLQNEIATAQQTIEKLNEERAPIAAEFRKVESEVGPIKYVAALIYGDNPDANLLERAVRWMIILLVTVFDPLAVALLIAANQTLGRHGIHLEKPDPTPSPKDKDDFAEKFVESKGTVDPNLDLEFDSDDHLQMPLDFSEPDQKKRSLNWRNFSLKSLKPSWNTLTDWSKSPVLNALLKLKKKSSEKYQDQNELLK